MEQEFPIKRDVLKAILLTAFLCLWLYWLWSRRNFYRFAKKFPGIFGYPIFGSLFVMKHLRYAIQGLGLLMERCKSNTICIWLGLYPFIVSTDPEFIEQILSSSEFLNKAYPVYMPIYKAFGGGIISSDESEWHHSRKMITPSFHHKVLLSFLPIFNKAKELTISLMDAMVDDNEHELVDMLQRISLGISVETTMGKYMKPGEKLSDEFTENYRLLLESGNNHIMSTLLKLDKLYLLCSDHLNVIEYMNKYISKLITLRMDNLKKKLVSNKDTEDSVISMKKSPKIFIDQAIQKFSLNEIVAESNNILFASFETSANGVFSALVMLATHPSIQDRLFDEIVSVFPEKDFEMEFDHMQHLPYLDMVVNETLRLAPSIPIIGRHVTRDTQLTKDLILPKGLQIIISIFHLHRRKDIWGPDADKFDPDNFLPENLSGKHSYAYIPFSKGMRNCIGWRYALFSVKVMLCGIIRNYRLTTSMKYEELEFLQYISLKYLKEPMFQIHRREK